MSPLIKCATSNNHRKVGKLNTYRKAPPEQLAELHPADRLMVQLIEIDRLGPRVEGMLYKTAFEESWTMLDEVRVPKGT
jgi:cytokinesis protein